MLSLFTQRHNIIFELLPSISVLIDINGTRRNLDHGSRIIALFVGKDTRVKRAIHFGWSCTEASDDFQRAIVKGTSANAFDRRPDRYLL